MAPEDGFESAVSYAIITTHKYYSPFKQIKVHFVIVTYCFYGHSSVDRPVGLFPTFQFSVDSEVSFMIYACFTVSYCCIDHYIGNYYLNINKSTVWSIVS